MRYAKAWFLAAVALGIVASAALGQSKSPSDQNWLVGYWEGKVSDPTKDKGGILEIRVKSIGADGVFAGEWDVYAGNHDVGQGKLQGDVVTITFRNGNVTTLRRQGADTLVGSTALAKGGQSNDFIFVKKSSDADAPVSSGAGCNFNTETTGGRDNMQVTEHWHLAEGEKTKYFDKLWQNGVLLGDGQFLCHDGHLTKTD